MTPDPETEMQSADGLEGSIVAAAVFTGLALWVCTAGACVRAWRWLTTRRQCAWCKCWLGGNPLLPRSRVSHGVCQSCREGVMKRKV